MADRPTEPRSYGAHNTAPPLSKFPAYAGVSLEIALSTQPAVSAYGHDQALPLNDTIRYGHRKYSSILQYDTAKRPL